jgi:hypothetical protein
VEPLAKKKDDEGGGAIGEQGELSRWQEGEGVRSEKWSGGDTAGRVRSGAFGEVGVAVQNDTRRVQVLLCIPWSCRAYPILLVWEGQKMSWAAFSECSVDRDCQLGPPALDSTRHQAGYAPNPTTQTDVQR